MDTPEGNSRRSWSGPQRGSGPRGTAGGTRATVLGSLTIPGRPEQVATARAFVARTLSSHQVGTDMTESSRPVGSGPGVITPDGCAVDFYARLAAMGEPEIVHGAIPPGSSILELGCGAGRVTHPLVALGHPVVAVDESPEMLAHIRGAETVRARIQDLALGRRFDVVLLASHLISTDDAAERR